MEKFDIHYAVKGRLLHLNIRAKKDAMIKGVYYSLYNHGVWLANIYKIGKQKYKALSYTGSLSQIDIDAIGQQIDLGN